MSRRAALVAALVAGAILAGQARVNGTLAMSVGTFPAAWASFGTGLALLSLGWLVPGFRRGAARVRQAVRTGRLPRWQLLGGMAGGLLVATQAYAVPSVGVAAFLVAVVGGQLSSALLVDHAGIGPTGRHPLTVRRLVASAVAVAGVVVTVAATGRPGEAVRLAPVLAAFAVGALVALQQGTNGQVTVAAGSPVPTAWLNFVTGSLTVALLGTVAVLLAGSTGAPGGAAPWWAWSGGVLGVVFIALVAWAVLHAGVLAIGLATITGQLAAALVIDLLVPTTRDRVSGQAVVGVAITVIAAAWSARTVPARPASMDQASLDSAP